MMIWEVVNHTMGRTVQSSVGRCGKLRTGGGEAGEETGKSDDRYKMRRSATQTRPWQVN